MKKAREELPPQQYVPDPIEKASKSAMTFDLLHTFSTAVKIDRDVEREESDVMVKIGRTYSRSEDSRCMQS